ncbi:MFS transporter [Streptomyces griseorubiginosus]|uniref:MFS transporter n=1 Tax=Streptomyces griseorubiginosus TaxID=67304 RepID=UPI0033EF13F7
MANAQISDVPDDDTATGEATLRAGLGQLTLLLAGICMPVLAVTLISPVVPQMRRHFVGIPGADVLAPMVLVAPALFLALASPFAGFLADRIDRKRFLLIAMAVYAVLGTAPLYLDSLYAIVATRVLLGVCEAVVQTCCTTLIGDYWTGRRRAKYLGLSTLVASLAAAALLAVGGLLGNLGWRAPFWLYLSSLLLVLPMARLLWQPGRTRQDRRAPLEPLPRRLILLPCLITLFGGMLFYALTIELPFVLDDIGLKASGAVGGVMAVMALSTALGAGLFARLSGRSAKVLLPAEFAGTAVGLVTVFATSSTPVVTAGAVITGFSTGLLLPTLLVRTVGRLTYAQRGRGTGWWSSALTFGQFSCPLAVAGLSAMTGGLQPALAVLGAVSAAVAVALAVTLRRDTAPLADTAGVPA